MYIEFPQTCAGDSCHHDWRQQSHHDIRLSQVWRVSPAHCSLFSAPCSFLPSNCSTAHCILVPAPWSLNLHICSPGNLKRWLLSCHQPVSTHQVHWTIGCTFVQYKLYNLLYTAHLNIILYDLRYTAHLYSIHCTIYCLLYTFSLYTIQFTVHCTFVHHTLHNLLYTAHLYIIHVTHYLTLHICTLYTEQT